MQEIFIRLSLDDEHYKLFTGRTVYLTAWSPDEFRAVIEARNAVLAALPVASSVVEEMKALRRRGQLLSRAAGKLLDRLRHCLDVAVEHFEDGMDLTDRPFWTAHPTVESNGGPIQ